MKKRSYRAQKVDEIRWEARVGRMPVRAIRRMEFIATTRSAERAQGASAYSALRAFESA